MQKWILIEIRHIFVNISSPSLKTFLGKFKISKPKESRLLVVFSPLVCTLVSLLSREVAEVYKNNLHIFFLVSR